MRIHIKKLLFTTLAAVLAVAMFSSCKDELEGAGGKYGQGNTTLKIVADGMPKVTRLLSDDQERAVNDLYVLAFEKTTGNLSKKAYFSSVIMTQGGDAQHYNQQAEVLIDLEHGKEFYLFAVSNLDHNRDGNLKTDLDGVTNMTEFMALQTVLSAKGSINRPTPSLTMCGTYEDPGFDYDLSNQTPASVVIPSDGNLPGYIHLRRLDAKFKFNIINETTRVSNDTTYTCTGFSIDSWKVYNVPSKSMVWENRAQVDTWADDTYGETNVFRQFDDQATPDPNKFSFSFYLPEQHKKPATGLTSYADREKRVSKEDRSFTNAPANATYVEFTATMQFNITVGGQTFNRYAQSTYTVHLGCCDEVQVGSTTNKFNDFNVLRNHSYTYNIRIQGVNTIVVEATSTDGIEPEPGVEGVVTDAIGGKVINLDSHYAVFNIKLTRDQISKLYFDVTSCLGNQNSFPGTSHPLNVRSEDYQAIRFAPLPADQQANGENYLVSYSTTYDADDDLLPPFQEVKQEQDGTHIHPLYGMQKFKQTFGEAANSEELWFTVFVNEYYYYYTNGILPTGYNASNTTQIDLGFWTEFVNSTNRRFTLTTPSSISADGHSEYQQSVYVINQKHMQSYYTQDKTLNPFGMSVEYYNEHHFKNLKNEHGMNGNWTSGAKTGWPYVNAALENKSWGGTGDVRAQQNVPIGHDYPTFATYTDNSANNYKASQSGRSDTFEDAKVYDAVDASLARNRDLNRNGIIESDELRWYLPALEQYMQIALGEAGLEKPLFEPNDYYQWPSNEGFAGSVITQWNASSGIMRYHFYGTEKTGCYWGEELVTIGMRQDFHANIWELRCVRDFGKLEHADLEPIYLHYPEQQLISFERYYEGCLRKEFIPAGSLRVHDCFERQLNSPYKYLKYAKQQLTGRNNKTQWNENAATMTQLINDNSEMCGLYSEEVDGSDLGTWRVPNQREAAILNLAIGIGEYHLDASYWKFNQNQWMVIGQRPTKTNLTSQSYKIRCVKDYKPGASPVLDFAFGELEKLSDGTYRLYAMMNPGATVNSVTLAGVTGTLDSSISHDMRRYYTFTSVPSISSLTAEWNVTFKGNTETKTKNYNNIVRYYVISSATSGHTTQYAYVNTSTKRTEADASANATAPENLGDAYKFIITKGKTTNPNNVSQLNTNDTYYLYSVALGKYLSGPWPTSGVFTSSYLTFEESNQVYTFRLKQFNSHYSFNINNCSGHGNLCFASWGTDYDYTKLGLFETSNQNRDGFKFIITPVY